MTIRVELTPDEEKAFVEPARKSGQDPVLFARQIIRDRLASSPAEAAPPEMSRFQRRKLRALDAIQRAVALHLHEAAPIDHFVCTNQELCNMASIEGLAILDPT